MQVARASLFVGCPLLFAFGAWWLVGNSGHSVMPPVESAPPAAPSVAEAERPKDRGASSCHSEALTASAIPIERTTATPPELVGGRLVDGVYDVFDYQVYGTVPDRALRRDFRQTMHILDGGRTTKNIRVGVRGQVETTTWTAEAMGNRLELEGRCPQEVVGAKESVTFEARGDLLLVGFEQAGAPVVVTYRRRSDI